MASVTGVTAPKMLEIESRSVTNAKRVGDNVVMVREGGVEINLGSFRGAAGPEGPEGPPGNGNVDSVNGILGPNVVLDKLFGGPDPKALMLATAPDFDGQRARIVNPNSQVKYDLIANGPSWYPVNRSFIGSKTERAWFTVTFDLIIDRSYEWFDTSKGERANFLSGTTWLAQITRSINFPGATIAANAHTQVTSDAFVAGKVIAAIPQLTTNNDGLLVWVKYIGASTVRIGIKNNTAASITTTGGTVMVTQSAQLDMLPDL